MQTRYGSARQNRIGRLLRSSVPRTWAVFDEAMESRREQLRTTLPIRRVVGPADIAALAVHLMTNTAVAGASFYIDGAKQLVEG